MLYQPTPLKLLLGIGSRKTYISSAHGNTKTCLSPDVHDCDADISVVLGKRMKETKKIASVAARCDRNQVESSPVCFLCMYVFLKDM